jgi:hypothetical protein
MDSDEDVDEEIALSERAMNLGIDEDELVSIKTWSKLLRIVTVVSCGLMAMIGLTNLIISESRTKIILSLLLLFSAFLLLTFEIAFKNLSGFMAENFGLLYNSYARALILGSLAGLSFLMDFFGSLLCFVLIIIGCVNLYIGIKHPLLGKYIQNSHFHMVGKGANRQQIALQHIEFYRVPR